MYLLVVDGCCTRFVDVESGILIINFRGEIETLVGFDVQVVHGSWAVRLKRMDGWFNGREVVWRPLVFFFSFLLRLFAVYFRSWESISILVYPFRLLIVAFDDRFAVLIHF